MSQISMPNPNQLAAIWHDALKVAGTLMMAGAAVSLVSQGTVTNFLADLQHLQNAGQEFWLALGGSTGLISLCTGLYLSLLANTRRSIAVAAVTQAPGSQLVTAPDIALDTPNHPDIVSLTENKVIPKGAL